MCVRTAAPSRTIPASGVTRENTMKIARVTAAVFALAFLGTFTMAPRQAGANGCKPDGQRCQTNISCCSRNCMKPVSPPGKAKPLFGTCCTPTTCRAGVDCGTIPDGDCTGFTLNCGNTCTGFNTCGGGGVSNQCGCTPNCANKNCGDNGCGGSCGSCAMSVCDTTVGMCVTCIPDGDQGCGNGFACCSGVCGAGGVCQSTTTTTTTTTASTTTTTICKTTADCTDSDCGPTADGCGGTIQCPCQDCVITCVNGGGAEAGFCESPADCAAVCATFGSPCVSRGGVETHECTTTALCTCSTGETAFMFGCTNLQTDAMN